MGPNNCLLSVYIPNVGPAAPAVIQRVIEQFFTKDCCHEQNVCCFGRFSAGCNQCNIQQGLTNKNFQAGLAEELPVVVRLGPVSTAGRGASKTTKVKQFASAEAEKLGALAERMRNGLDAPSEIATAALEMVVPDLVADVRHGVDAANVPTFAGGVFTNAVASYQESSKVQVDPADCHKWPLAKLFAGPAQGTSIFNVHQQVVYPMGPGSMLFYFPSAQWHGAVLSPDHNLCVSVEFGANIAVNQVSPSPGALVKVSPLAKQTTPTISDPAAQASEPEASTSTQQSQPNVPQGDAATPGPTMAGPAEQLRSLTAELQAARTKADKARNTRDNVARLGSPTPMDAPLVQRATEAEAAVADLEAQLAKLKGRLAAAKDAADLRKGLPTQAMVQKSSRLVEAVAEAEAMAGTAEQVKNAAVLAHNAGVEAPEGLAKRSAALRAAVDRVSETSKSLEQARSAVAAHEEEVKTAMAEARSAGAEMEVDEPAEPVTGTAGEATTEDLRDPATTQRLAEIQTEIDVSTARMSELGAEVDHHNLCLQAAKAEVTRMGRTPEGDRDNTYQAKAVQQAAKVDQLKNKVEGVTGLHKQARRKIEGLVAEQQRLTSPTSV